MAVLGSIQNAMSVQDVLNQKSWTTSILMKSK